jgi:hypothetical protein
MPPALIFITLSDNKHKHYIYYNLQGAGGEWLQNFLITGPGAVIKICHVKETAMSTILYSWGGSALPEYLFMDFDAG